MLPGGGTRDFLAEGAGLLTRRWVLPVTVVLIAGLLLAALPVRDRLLEERRKSGLKELDLSKVPPLGAAGILLLGGFRGVAVDILWIRVLTLHQDRRYDEEIGLIELITRLQPYYISVWVFQAWNIAYNISVQYPSPSDQWERVKYGIDFLKRGLALNPNNGDLYFYLGLMYRDKVHQNAYFEQAMERELGENNFESAAEYFKRARELGGVQTFAPRVVDSGVFHAYLSRTQQILERAELTDNLTFPAETLRRAQTFIDKCREESEGLQKRWPADAAFELFPARIDLVLCDGWLLQVDKILASGRSSDESLARARKVLDKALAELANYRPKYQNTHSEQVIRNRTVDAYTRIPLGIVHCVRELVNAPSAGPAEWREGVRLLGRAESELNGVPPSVASYRDCVLLRAALLEWRTAIEDLIRKHELQGKPGPAGPGVEGK